jgi:hypothetical protein
LEPYLASATVFGVEKRAAAALLDPSITPPQFPVLFFS